MKHQSTKLIDGFSTCFRQEKSAPSHCSVLHGYSLSFKITFEGELDDCNWVVDFGFLKKTKTPIQIPELETYVSTLDDWFKLFFDHSTLVASNDSQREWFVEAHNRKILRVIFLKDGVGCERFAELVFKKLHWFVAQEFKGRVRLVSVECFEHAKNSAIVCQ